MFASLEKTSNYIDRLHSRSVDNKVPVFFCSEAEYTFQLRRDVIPLMMEKNYTPDGWLGMIVGAKLWIDFRAKRNVTSGLEKLVKELKDRGRQEKEELVQGS